MNKIFYVIVCLALLIGCVERVKNLKYMTDGTSVHLKWKQPGVKLSIIDGFVISYMYVYMK